MLLPKSFDFWLSISYILIYVCVYKYIIYTIQSLYQSQPVGYSSCCCQKKKDWLNILQIQLDLCIAASQKATQCCCQKIVWTLNFKYFPNIQPARSLLNVVNDDEYEENNNYDEKLLFGQLGVACNGLIMKMRVLRMMIMMMMVMTMLMIMMIMMAMMAMMMMMIKSSCWVGCSSHAMAFSHTLL